MSLRAAIVVLLLLPAVPEGGQKRNIELPPIAPLDLGAVLDLYAAGQFNAAVQRVARAGDQAGRNLRHHWAEGGRQWIEADPDHRPQRMLAAAALALETEHVRAERGDWRMGSGNPPCAAACALDWSQFMLIERGAPDPAERAWYLAAAALTGGVRDWRYLQRPIDPARPGRLTGLMDRAVARFPGDAAIRLEQAIAAAGRFNVLGESGRIAPGMVPPLSVIAGRGTLVLADFPTGSPDLALEMLAALTNDSIVGAEARLRLGYLHWALGRDAAARDELAKAAGQAGDSDVRYLAQFLLGWIAVVRGDSAAAIPPLEAALAARPDSQSAAIALASLELQRGDADKAHRIAQASLDRRRADADPWRLFLYGHHPQWPERIAQLRRLVRP